MGFFTRLFGGGGTSSADGAGAGGDGSSAASAVVVGSVGEEYEWIGRHCSGFVFEMQTLQKIGGKPYDVMTLRNARRETRMVYFDISRFYGIG